jgi:hypothetical protein
MTQPSAAGQIWPHLPHDDEQVTKQSKSSLAESLWPGLSASAKAKEASQAWVREWVRKEQRESNARMVEHLRQINERLKAERR